MKRREFLKSGALVVAAPFLHRAARGAEVLFSARSARPHAIAVARGREPGRGLRKAVDALGGPALLARPGERVLLKPALAWNRAPGTGANVEPGVLRAAIELALEGGAARVTLFDRTSLRAETVYDVSGAARVVAAIGDPRVEMIRLREEDFVPLAASRRAGAGPSSEVLCAFRDLGASLERFLVSRHALEADRIVNVATVRHHPTRKASLAFANLLGLIGGWPIDGSSSGRRDAELVLVGAALCPELTVLDATHVIVRNGPAGRDPSDVERRDVVAVSGDAVAVEAMGASLLGLRPDALPHIGLAAKLGLGRIEAGRKFEV
jgi:uncharacterized protein (DUF362 family)